MTRDRAHLSGRREGTAKDRPGVREEITEAAAVAEAAEGRNWRGGADGVLVSRGGEGDVGTGASAGFSSRGGQCRGVLLPVPR